MLNSVTCGATSVRTYLMNNVGKRFERVGVGQYRWKEGGNGDA